MDSGSAIPSTSREDFYNLNAIIPELPTQITIASLLSSLDDKIELNNAINKNLEKLAQALFKQWFVDFEFPNDNGESYKSSGGEMVDSELVEIPKSWTRSSLDEIADFLNGLALQKFPVKSQSESLPVIKIRELKNGITDSTDRANRELPIKYIVQNGDVLFSWSGSLAIDFWCNGEGALNQHLFKVTSNKYPKWFYFLWTNFHLGEFISIAESKATTMGHIQRKHLSDAKVLVPTSVQISRFSESFEPLYSHLIGNRIENNHLINLRDTILPKLMSGELSILEAEKLTQTPELA